MKSVLEKHDEYLSSEGRGDKGVYQTYIAPKSKKSPRIQMNPTHVKKAIPLLVRVQYALQWSLNQKTIKVCFQPVGINFDKENVDFNKVMLVVGHRISSLINFCLSFRFLQLRRRCRHSR